MPTTCLGWISEKYLNLFQDGVHKENLVTLKGETESIGHRNLPMDTNFNLVTVRLKASE